MGQALYHDGACTCATLANLTQKVGLPGRGKVYYKSGDRKVEKICVFDREIEKFIIRQPPTGEKDDHDSENSWISDGLPLPFRFGGRKYLKIRNTEANWAIEKYPGV